MSSYTFFNKTKNLILHSVTRLSQVYDEASSSIDTSNASNNNFKLSTSSI